jgi:hypothetical protein
MQSGYDYRPKTYPPHLPQKQLPSIFPTPLGKRSKDREFGVWTNIIRETHLISNSYESRNCRSIIT